MKKKVSVSAAANGSINNASSLRPTRKPQPMTMTASAAKPRRLTALLTTLMRRGSLHESGGKVSPEGGSGSGSGSGGGGTNVSAMAMAAAAGHVKRHRSFGDAMDFPDRELHVTVLPNGTEHLRKRSGKHRRWSF